MNHKAPYEHLIGEKLETLPVPDMADAIWARIEAQLDTDLPADDGDGPVPEGPPVAGGSWSQTLLFVTIIAIMSLFTIPKKNITAPLPAATETTAPAPSDEATAQPPPASQSSAGSAQPTLPVARGGSPQPSDSTAVLPAPALLDTVIAGNAIVQQQAPPAGTMPVQQDTLPGKRPRGVPGIGDGDYRIVPKKDSTGGN